MHFQSLPEAEGEIAERAGDFLALDKRDKGLYQMLVKHALFFSNY